MVIAALFLRLALASIPSLEEVPDAQSGQELVDMGPEMHTATHAKANPLRAQVEELEHRLSESIKDKDRMEAELQAVLKGMEKQLQQLGASLEKAGPATSRKLYPESIAAAWENSDDDVTGSTSFIPEITTAMGTTWTILCGALVMFMHAGFALLETGVCRAVSCQSILLKNILNVCFGTMIWFTFGYAFMYGGVDDSPLPIQIIGGMGGYLGSGMVDTAAGEMGMGYIGPNHLITCQDWFFQWAFCVTGATIVSGGVAERLQLGGYLVFTTWMTGIIYPTVGAMTWGGGFLYDLGYSDFAGSGIVHLTGGVGALVGAFVTKPRLGRFSESGTDPDGPYAPHNVPNAALGTFILWFGWYGFNCGSTLYMTGFSDAQSAGLVAVNTTLAPAAGGIAALILRRFVLEPRRLTVTSVCGGILAGLVSITAGCGNVHPIAAIPIGFVGGVLYCLASDLLQKLKIDDPVEAFPVHGAGGMWGVLSLTLFDMNMFDGNADADSSTPEKELFGPGITFTASLTAQLAGIVVIVAWSGILSFIMFSIIKALKLLRVEAEVEEEGLDFAEFSPKMAYRGSVMEPSSKQSTAATGVSAVVPEPKNV
jgi:Amt family ammonium transporter